MSEETFSASDMSIGPKLALLAFWYSRLPYSQWPGSSICSVGVIRPFSSMPSAVTGLNVEPVG